MRQLCARTLCIHKPGCKMAGMYCHFIHTGKMPATGRQACCYCGRTKPEPKHEEGEPK